MNRNERKIFWDTLCSLPGTNIDSESSELVSKILYPDKIYRYRAITTSTIDALQTNKLYFSTANYYDDPFDTNIMIDMEEIRNKARVCSHKNSVKNHSKHNHSDKSSIKLIITSENFSKTF